MNCTAAKQCKLCISDDVTGIAADCLIATMVAAMRYAGFKVAMLALGNEGARCVFGDKVSTVQGNYGHYPNYLAAHNPLLNPSAACGLDYCLHEILGCADLLAEFPLVTCAGFTPHSLLYKDKAQVGGHQQKFVNAFAPPPWLRLRLDLMSLCVPIL